PWPAPESSDARRWRRSGDPERRRCSQAPSRESAPGRRRGGDPPAPSETPGRRCTRESVWYTPHRRPVRLRRWGTGRARSRPATGIAWVFLSHGGATAREERAASGGRITAARARSKEKLAGVSGNHEAKARQARRFSHRCALALEYF